MKKLLSIFGTTTLLVSCTSNVKAVEDKKNLEIIESKENLKSSIDISKTNSDYGYSESDSGYRIWGMIPENPSWFREFAVLRKKLILKWKKQNPRTGSYPFGSYKNYFNEELITEFRNEYTNALKPLAFNIVKKYFDNILKNWQDLDDSEKEIDKMIVELKAKNLIDKPMKFIKATKLEPPLLKATKLQPPLIKFNYYNEFLALKKQSLKAKKRYGYDGGGTKWKTITGRDQYYLMYLGKVWSDTNMKKETMGLRFSDRQTVSGHIDTTFLNMAEYYNNPRLQKLQFMTMLNYFKRKGYLKKRPAYLKKYTFKKYWPN